MIQFQYLPYSKEQQTQSKRVKLTQKQMGEISNKVRAEVLLRSGGKCEVRIKCKGDQAVQQAHTRCRGRMTHKTTAKDLLDACIKCHDYLDKTGDGTKLRRQLRSDNGD